MHSRSADRGIYWISETCATTNDWRRQRPTSRIPGACRQAMSNPQTMDRPTAGRDSAASRAAEIGASAWVAAIASLVVISAALIGFHWNAAASAVEVWY